MTKILQLKCRFCSKITGQYTYPDNLTVADLHIADVRCSDHEQEFGSYTKMEQDFKGTHKEFISIMEKSEYKRSKFDAEMVKIQAELVPVLGSSKLRKSKKCVKIK